jgi:hypothetical protein
MTPSNPEYEVSLSFAGEQRSYVGDVAKHLAARGIKAFYDRFETVNLWGKDQVEAFHHQFASNTKFVVMFISKEYVEKMWPRHERRSAFSAAIKKGDEYILPVRFDDTEVPGLPDTVGYVRAKDHSPAELAVLISQKIGVPALAAKASQIPPPQMSAATGEVSFDYSAFNGRFVIGSNQHQFETAWSKASDTDIHLYNDPPSIHGVAVARGATDISSVVDASAYDFSSRSRTVYKGGVAILRNTNGFYAALKILDIRDDTRGAEKDELTFRFAIQTDGSPSFVTFKDDADTPGQEVAEIPKARVAVPAAPKQPAEPTATWNLYDLLRRVKGIRARPGISSNDDIVASIYDRLQQGALKAWGRRSTTYPPAAASHPRPLREFIDASFWKENIIEELEYWLKQPYLQQNKPVLTITKPVAGDRITAIQYWDLVFSATEANHLWPAQRV